MDGSNGQDRWSSTIIHLCRHGETPQNLTGVLQGQMDTPLNETGQAQALMLGKELRRRADTGTATFAGTVYSSDLARASETAQAVMRELDGERTLITDARLRERSLGRFEGRTQAESQHAEPNEWQRFASGKPVDGVEPPASVGRRAAAAVRAIAAAHPDAEVLVFSHGGTVHCALEAHVPPTPTLRGATGPPARRRSRGRPSCPPLRRRLVPDLGHIAHITNCSITTIEVPAGGGSCLARTIGDAAHISGGGTHNADVMR